MPIPARLSTSLHTALGDNAGADMVTWMHNADTQRQMAELEIQRFEFKVDAFRHEFRADLAEFKHQVHVDAVNLKAEVNNSIAAETGKLRTEMAAEFAKVRDEMTAFGATLRSEVKAAIAEQSEAQLRWAIGLWLATIGLLGTLIISRS